MATVRKLPSGNYQVRIVVDGERLSNTFATAEAAHAWVDRLEKPTQSTILSFKNDYLSEVMIRDGKKRGGYEAISYKLDALGRIIDKPLESINSVDVSQYKVKRSREVSASSVRLEMQLLSRFLRWANTEKGIECTDVVKGVKLPDAGKPRSKIITPLEYQMILEKVSDRARPIVILAWETAMRRNELLAITPAMVDLKKKIISLPNEICKNGEGRDVPLSPKAVELLKALCDGKEKGKELFTLTPYAITQAFRRAARLCKVTDVCLHSLRHTAISRWAELGFSTVQLQVISGHKSLDMLQRYTHLKASNIAAKMNELTKYD